MITLAEVEAAADELTIEQKKQLLLFLAERLRNSGQALPPPRAFTTTQIQAWITEDERDRA